MNLKDMTFCKCSTEIGHEKQALGKESNNSYPYRDIENYPNVGVRMPLGWIGIDFDRKQDFLAVSNMVRELGIKCNIMKSSKGGHIWFKTKGEHPNAKDFPTILGVRVDSRCGSNEGYLVVKLNHEWREWVEPVYDFDELDELPIWLTPLRGAKWEPTQFLLCGMSEGSRDDTFYNYICALYTGDFGLTKDDIREGLRLANKYMLNDPMDKSQIEKILRDDAFDQLRLEKFFEKNKFLHEKYGDYFIKKHGCYYVDNTLYTNTNGDFVSEQREFEKLMLEDNLGLTKAQRNEVYAYLELKATDVEHADCKYIKFKNCILNLDNMDVLPRTKDLFIRDTVDSFYDPTVTSYKEIDDIIDKISQGNKGIENILWEMFGYTLYRSTDLQKSFLLYGNGSNGKSTLLKMLKMMLGPKNHASLSLQDLNDKFRLANLCDKLANIGDDISGVTLKDTSVFKNVTSGDEITVEQKYKNARTLKPQSTLIFATNNLPLADDKSDGFYRRFIPIPLDARISPTDADYNPRLFDDINNERAKSYLVNKSVQALRNVLKNKKFTIIQEIDDLLQLYKKENDSTHAFIDAFGVEYFLNRPVVEVAIDYGTFCETHMLVQAKPPVFNSTVKSRTGMTNTLNLRKPTGQATCWGFKTKKK